MKKAIYLFFFIIFAILSSDFIFTFSSISKVFSKIYSLFGGFLLISFFFPLAILFFLLYAREKYKCSANSQKNFRGAHIFKKILFSCFVISIFDVIFDVIFEIYKLSKPYSIYLTYSFSTFRDCLIFILSHSYILSLFFFSSRIVSHFIKKWDSLTTQDNKEV